jgi:hypothetical protein
MLTFPSRGFALAAFFRFLIKESVNTLVAVAYLKASVSFLGNSRTKRGRWTNQPGMASVLFSQALLLKPILEFSKLFSAFLFREKLTYT